MPGFLVSLAINFAIQLALNQLARLLEPRQKRPRPQALQPPTASSGTPLGKSFGIFEAQPTVVLVHQPALEQDEQNDIPITRYYVKLNLMCGWGPINIIYDIVSDERSIRTLRPSKAQSIDGDDPNIIFPLLPFDFDANPSAGIEFSINARQIYGGGTEQGGLQGLLMLYPGVTDQPIDPLTLEVDGDLASAYPWGVYARLGAETGRAEGLSTSGANQQGDKFYVSSNTPTPFPISFVFGAYPDRLLGDGGRMGLDANMAEVLFDAYLDQKWGARKSINRFDVPQWTAKATQIRKEGIGISVPRDEPRSFDDLKEDLLTHLDGGVVEDPTTGLLQLKLARPDYVFDDLLTINKSNANNFKRGKSLPPRTLNDIQIRYRRFHGGVSGAITSEFATRDLDWNYWNLDPNFPPGRAFIYKSAGDHLEAGTIHAFADDVELTLDVDFQVNLERGTWYFFNTAAVDEGMEIRIEYVASPTFVAFVDDVATSQNIANQQNTGRQQIESYDYPFYTNPIAAQWKADRLRSTMSRSLDTFSWDGKRDQSRLTPWDVVKVLEPEWGITEPIAIRITKVNRGTRTNPRLSFEGVKDLWGEQLLLRSINDNPGVGLPAPAAPAMGIACGIGGAEISRIDLFPSDAVYDVEVWEADDENGTNAVLVETVDAGTEPMFYDGAEGKFYAARQRNSFTQPGPFTSWITCAAVDEPPVDPVCVRPTYVAIFDDINHIVTIELTDSQGRVQLVEFRSRSGNGLFSVWQPETFPYCGSVTPHPTETSRVEWRITYLDCDGTIGQLLGGHDFVVAPTEPEPEAPAITQVPILIPLLGYLESRRFREIPAEMTPLDENGASQTKLPLDRFVAARIVAPTKATNVPVGCRIVGCYEHPDFPDVFVPMDGSLGPFLDIDSDSVGTDLKKARNGDWVTIDIGARMDVRLQGFLVGGDEDPLKFANISRVDLELSAGANIPTPIPPEESTEPPFDPGTDGPPCGGLGVLPYHEKMIGWWESDCGEIVAHPGWDEIIRHYDLSGQGRDLVRLNPSLGHGVLIHGTDGSFTEEQLNGRYAAVMGQVDYAFPVGMMDGVSGAEVFYVARGPNGDPSANSDVTYWWKWGTATSGGPGRPAGSSFGSNGWPAWVPSTVLFAGHMGDDFGSTIFRDWGNPTPSMASWHVLSVDARSTRYVSRIDGTIQLNAGGNTVAWRNQPMLMSFNNKGRINWTCCVAYQSLTDEERANVIATLGDNYNLSVGGGGTVGGDPPEGGTGGGDDGNEPIPDPPVGGWPPPVTGGARKMEIHNIPSSGFAYFNQTTKVVTPSNAVNLIASAESGDSTLLVRLGPEANWKDPSGSFDFDRWYAQFLAIYNNITVRNAIIAAYTGLSRRIWAWWLFDEPSRSDRYGPGGISWANVIRAASVIKTGFPNIPIILRVDPTDTRLPSSLPGIDIMWAEYNLLRGPIDTYVSSRLAAAAARNVGLFFGIHYFDFGGPGSNTYITADQLRFYGKKLTDNSVILGFGGWKWSNALWSRPGIPDAARFVRDNLGAHDP